MSNCFLFRTSFKNSKEIIIPIRKNLNSCYWIFKLKRKWMQNIDLKKYKER